MRFLRYITLAALASMLAAPAFADGGIAVVNVQKIMSDSTAAKSIRDQLQSKQKSFQADLDAKEKALQQEDQDLMKQRANLSEDAFKQKVDAFRQKAMGARQEIQDKRSQLDKGFAGALNNIQSTTLSIVSDIAKEKNYTLVLSSAQVLYSGGGMDITDDVLARLNKKLPSVPVKF